MNRGVNAAAATVWLVALVGCGLAANPQPPTLWLPAPAKDLAATRVGDEVHLHWTMPKSTTDKVTLKGDQQAHFCWASEALVPQKAVAVTTAPAGEPGVAGKPATAGKTEAQTRAAPIFDQNTCRSAGDGLFAPDKPADFTATMPPELIVGPPRAVSYYLELENRAGKTAGPSNAAWVAAGAAPPAVTGLHLETRTEGVVLHWDAAAPEKRMVVRIRRTLSDEAGARKPNQAYGASLPKEQVLEVDLDKGDPGVALDRDAALDHEWKYSAERVVLVDLDRHALEIAGSRSAVMTIDAKDVFPPAVPAGLAAVADAQAKAIDLSWAPNTEPDLAGYVVYRRDVTAGAALARISGKALVVPPSFSDATVVAGHRYAYAVSAVDADGNESARAGEVVEELPQ